MSRLRLCNPKFEKLFLCPRFCLSLNAFFSFFGATHFIKDFDLITLTDAYILYPPSILRYSQFTRLAATLTCLRPCRDRFYFENHSITSSYQLSLYLIASPMSAAISINLRTMRLSTAPANVNRFVAIKSQSVHSRRREP